MKFTDFVSAVVVAVVIAGFFAFGVWHSNQVEKVGRVLDNEYHIVCPEDGSQCHSVKN